MKWEVDLSAGGHCEGGYLLDSKEWGQFIGLKHQVLFGRQRVAVSVVLSSSAGNVFVVVFFLG